MWVSSISAQSYQYYAKPNIRFWVRGKPTTCELFRRPPQIDEYTPLNYVRRRRGSSKKPSLSLGNGYDTFSNTSASHCG
jgi:hypothetical protein